MPRPRKLSVLDQQLLSIAQRMTNEVGHLVRAHVASELTRIINGSINGIAVQRRAPRAAGATGPRRTRRGGVSDAFVSSVLEVIKRSPGLRSEQLYKKFGQSPDAVKAALAKLREKKKVKTTGTRRAMTYRAA